MEALVVIMSFSMGIVALIGGIMVKLDREKARHEQGLANNELAQKVARLEKTNAEYARRLEDLEAIVVSRSWTTLPEPPQPALHTGDHLRIAAAPHQVSAPAVEERNRQQVAELARRLSG